MKKTVLLFSLVLSLVGLTACGLERPSYKVGGKLNDESFNNTMIYITSVSGTDHLDSTLVVDGQFEFRGTIAEPIEALLKLSDSHKIPFILENGEITIDSEVGIAKGSYMNRERNLYNQTMAAFRAQFEEKEAELKRQYAGDLENPQFGIDLLNFNKEVLEPQRKEFIIEFLKKHNNSFLGVDPLRGLNARTSGEELKSYLAMAGPNLLANEVIVNMVKGNKAEVKTAVGEMFTDFTVENREGEPALLSDYLGKGKYVLVDFWASWCGPCLAEVSHLLSLYDKYKGEEFEILGVAVLDKPAATLEVIDKLSLPWPQLLNAQNTPFEVYGIKRIPYLILVAPDGTILHRDIRGDAIDAILADLFE